MNPYRLLDAESESLSLTDIKNHLRISGTDDDDSLREDIAAVRRYTETYLSKTLVKTTWVYKLDSFPDEINLQMGPVLSISSVEYVDTDGNTQTFSDIQYDDRNGRLKPSYNSSWPDTRDQYNAVTITYIAGATHAGNVADDIKSAMKMLVGDKQNNKEDSLIGVSNSPLVNSAHNILNMYRNWQV